MASHVAAGEIFFVKIDVGGFECPVLQGARRLLLCQHKIRYIAMEFSHYSRHIPLCPALLMIQYMQDLGDRPPTTAATATA